MSEEKYLHTSKTDVDVVWKVYLLLKESEASVNIQAVNRAKQTRNVNVVARGRLEVLYREYVSRSTCQALKACNDTKCLCHFICPRYKDVTLSELTEEESSAEHAIPEFDIIHGSFTKSFRVPTYRPELILNLTIWHFTGASSKRGDQVSCSPLSKGILELFASNEMADVVFVVEGEEVRAHTLVLSALSSVWKIMFTKYPERRIEVEDAKLTAFKEMIRCAVADCDPVVCDSEDLLGILYLAEKYDLQSLKSRCEKILLSVVTKDNVWEILVLCDKLSPASVKAIAGGLVGNWLKDLLQGEESDDFCKNHPAIAVVVLRAALEALV